MPKHVLCAVLGAALLAMPMTAAFADEPIPNASIAVKDAMGKVVAETKTDAMGHFMIGVLPPGPCSIDVLSWSWGASQSKMAAPDPKATPHTLKIELTEVLVTSITKLITSQQISGSSGEVLSVKFTAPDLKPPVKGFAGSFTLVK